MKRHWSVIPTFLIALAFALAACSAGRPAPKIEVSDAWVLFVGAQMQGGEPTGMQMGSTNGVAYMVLHNRGNAPDRLLRVQSDVAHTLELHKSEVKNGVMMMNPVEFVEVPAGGQAELKPGGLHVMLIRLTRGLTPGDQVTLTLVFETSGEITVQAEVRAP